MSELPPLATAELVFDDRGNPRSRRFDDFYFQADTGPAESEFVFLQGSDLPQRWRNSRCFTVGETGFGSGLNFLLTWSAWRNTCTNRQRLHFVSAERFPLTLAQLSRIHQLWPQLAPLSARLRLHYPVQTPGFHRLHLSESVTLTLMFGDAQACLKQLEAVVDAWYLDGFAPARNPAMWSAALLGEVARLSANGATAATFTAAGQVRRDLSRLGFEVRRAPGYGSKRERLLGRFAGQPVSGCPLWFAPPPTIDESLPVSVVGAGAAGAAIQRALARRQLSPRLVHCAAGASDIPAATVMPRLEAGDGAAGRFFWQAWRYAIDYWGDTPSWDDCGALLLDRDARATLRHRRIASRWFADGEPVRHVSADATAEIAGLALGRGGLWFREAGVVRGVTPASASDRPLTRVYRSGDHWWLEDEQGQQQTSTVVLCTGASQPLAPHALPMQRWHGLTLQLAATPRSGPLRCALHGGGYVVPAAQGGHWTGATFEPEHSRSAPDIGQRLLQEKLATAFPELELAARVIGRWHGTRCALPDRLPVAGPLAHPEASTAALGWLRHGRPVPGRDGGPAWWPGLWIIGGLGARGYTSAPLLGEWVASMMTGDPWPLPRDVALAVCSSRFLARDLRRG